jgi:ubiquitin-protein ligase
MSKSSKPRYDLPRLPPRERRLAKDHIELHELCERSDRISYEILKQVGKMPPEAYKVHFKVKSIIDIDDQKMPKFGSMHTARIEFPPEYPGDDGKPMCYMLTDTWHPNIKHAGDYVGRICVDAKSLGAWHSLEMLVLRIGEILQYKNYLAENVPPYPEDEKVAQWVRNFAEPKGLIGPNKPVDKNNLLLPISEEFVERPPLAKPVIKITKRGQYIPPSSSDSSPTQRSQHSAPSQPSISISKRKKS